MHTKIRKTQWVLALSAALLAALLAATTAFAESEQPPVAPPAEESAAEAPADAQPAQAAPEPEAPPPAPEGEAVVEDTPAPAGEAAAVEPPAEETALEPAADAETAPLVEEAAPAQEIAAEPAPVADTSAGTQENTQEALAEIAAEAAESGVVLADESGGALPLTEASSAELLGGGDPYYKVGLTEYNFYAAAGACGSDPHPTCFDDQGTDVIQDALDHMATTGLPSNRMLYVQGGTYDGFTIDGSSIASPWLRLLGGVIGEDGSESTFIDGNVIVQNNAGGFTLSGFTLNSGGSIDFMYNSGTLKLTDVTVRNSDGTNPYALDIDEHAGAVVLDGVNVSDNAGDGAFIDTTGGSYPITIKNSAFNHNGLSLAPATGYTGLTAASWSTITINGVSASDNKGDGIVAWSYTTFNLKNAVLSNNKSSVGSYGYALYAESDGISTANLEHVYAYDNTFGLTLYDGSLNAKYIEANDSDEGYGLYFYSETGSSRVEYGQFHNNFVDGLYIENKGAIYLNSINSSDNGGSGAYLDNYFSGSGAGNVTITSPVSGGWQLANGFFNNDDTGVSIHSHGSVLISNADMGDNGSIGLMVNNSYGLGSVTVNVTITDWHNGMSYNDNQGISINSRGAVTLSKTRAAWNGDTGIEVSTLGNITLANVSSTSNYADGAILENHTALLPHSVTLTNCSFDHNEGNGLEVRSNGSITAYGLSASGNSLRYSEHVDSYADVITYHDVLGDNWVEDRFTFWGNSTYDVDLYLKSFDFDAYLEVYSPSGSLIASADGGWDDENAHIYIGSLPQTGEYTVVVKSDGNSGRGEYWYSVNDPTHSNITADLELTGAYLNNTFGKGAVRIYKPTNLNQMWGNFFDLNTAYGIDIHSNGTILLDSAAANHNFFGGAYLDNPNSSASVTVSNSRSDDFYSDFSGNGSSGVYSGVYIETRGNVTLKNISAWNNGSSGVFVDNCQYSIGDDTCLGFGGVQVLALGDRSNDLGYNDGNGLEIFSKGSILLTNIYAENNTDSGVYIFNGYDGASGFVTLTASTNGWNNFYQNGGDGLYVESGGSISLSKLDANLNGSDGADLSNVNSASLAGILITRGYFSENDGYGLQAESAGAMLWRYGNAYDNDMAGAALNNTAGSLGISVLGSASERMEFDENGWEKLAGNGGLLIHSHGKITIAYINATNNNGDGFHLENLDSPAHLGVDATEIEARWNKWNGVMASSTGTVTIRGIASEGNGYHGAVLSNQHYGSTANVTVTNTLTRAANEFEGNIQGGLYITSNGSIYLKNIDSWGNTLDGISISNYEGTGIVSFITTGKQFWLTDNGGYGLYIDTKGSVLLSNQYGLNAHDNGAESGIFIDNIDGLSTNTVSLYKVFANNNYNGAGVWVEAAGKVTAVSTTAQNNHLIGLHIYSDDGSVTISGSNLFTDNGTVGLNISAPGAISISNVRAWHNGNEGVNVSGTGANVTLNSIISAHNQYSGIYLRGMGNFYLNRVTAFLNGQTDAGSFYDDGLYITADSSTSTVTILNSTFMNNWNGSGIEITHPEAGDPIAPFWPTLFNTSYLSNGETNVWVHLPPP